MFEKIRTMLRNMKLSKKMLLVYSIFAGGAAIISMVALQISLNIYDEKLYEKSLQELDYFTQQVNATLDEIEKFSYEIAMSSNIQKQLSDLKNTEYLSAEYAYKINALRNTIEDELNDQNHVKNIIYTDDNKMQFQTGVATADLEDHIKSEILAQTHERRGGYTFKSPTRAYPFLLSGRDILERKNISLDYLGTILLSSDIHQIIEEKNEQLEATHSTLFVYSADGMIYKDQEEQILGLPDLGEQQGYKVVNKDGRKYFMCYLTSSKTDWMYVNWFEYSEIFGQTVMIRYIMLIGFVLVFLCMSLAMRKVSYVITKPLEHLTESMRIVETGNFQDAKAILQQKPRYDETGLLTQRFGIMLDKIDVLIHENYEKQLLLKDTKYKMLQAQINPHFLYNTLNALNWMIKAGKNEDAVTMIMELGVLLRASFAKEPYTTVYEEIKAAKSYITIQQYRYRSRAEFHIETTGNLKDFIVPRMILQPLIENSVCYGVENAVKVCHITVKVIEEEKTIYMEVSDTGIGMTKEELEGVRNHTITPKGHGIGIKNIVERLNITYENSEFQIESESGKGTIIAIRIPKVRRENENV